MMQLLRRTDPLPPIRGLLGGLILTAPLVEVTRQLLPVQPTVWAALKPYLTPWLLHFTLPFIGTEIAAVFYPLRLAVAGLWALCAAYALIVLVRWASRPAALMGVQRWVGRLLFVFSLAVVVAFVLPGFVVMDRGSHPVWAGLGQIPPVDWQYPLRWLAQTGWLPQVDWAAVLNWRPQLAWLPRMGGWPPIEAIGVESGLGAAAGLPYFLAAAVDAALAGLFISAVSRRRRRAGRSIEQACELPAPETDAVSADTPAETLAAADADAEAAAHAEAAAAAAAMPVPTAEEPGAVPPFEAAPVLPGGGDITVDTEAADPAPKETATGPADSFARVRSRAGPFAQQGATVAVSFGFGTVKILQGLRRRNQLVIFGGGVYPVPQDIAFGSQIMDPQGFARLLVERMRELRIRSRRITAAVGGEGSVLRTVTFPRMTEAELGQAMRWEADKYLPFAADEAHIDYKIADLSVAQLWGEAVPAGGQIPVLLGACQRSVVDAYMQTCKHARFEPIELEPHALAAFRALRLGGGVSPLTAVVALVHVGLDGTTITVFKHGYPLFHRHLSARGISRPMDIPVWWPRSVPLAEPEQFAQLCQEVGRSLEAALLRLKPDGVQIYLTGEGAILDSVRRDLNAYLLNSLRHVLSPVDGSVFSDFPTTLATAFAQVPAAIAAAPELWAAPLGLLARAFQLPLARLSVKPSESAPIAGD